MLTKRIIPCLDVNKGKVVKGVNFVNLKNVGNPVEIAESYSRNGADEIVFLDITATYEERKTMIDVVKKTAEKVFIPFTVGGGIRTIEDIKDILRCGADKVALNSSAVRNPDIIKNASDKFGSQCIVSAIDAKKISDGKWNVFIDGGRTDTGIDVFDWAEKVQKLGAGEILLTSMDADGTKKGFDIELTEKVGISVNIPIIASGGCGKIEDFYQVFKNGVVDAALAASIFHYETETILNVKKYLYSKGIPVRLI